MKVLSLTQPYATLIAIGAKTIETRSWFSSYRGELAIHAAKGLGPIGGHQGFIDLCLTEPFHSVLSAHMRTLPNPTPNSYLDELPLGGGVVAVVDLFNCRHTQGEYGTLPAPWVEGLDEQEKAFGNYGPKRYGWFFENIRKLRQPVPCRGVQGLRDLPPDIEELVRKQIV